MPKIIMTDNNYSAILTTEVANHLDSIACYTQQRVQPHKKEWEHV